MTTSYRAELHRNGFTLIEAIISIVIIAIVVVMMLSYFSVGITRSFTPLVNLQASTSVNQIMEMITARYTVTSHWRASTAYAINSSVIPTMQNQNGCMYIAVTGGTSGSNEPLWPTTSSGTVTDGTITWSYNGTVLPQWVASSSYAVGSIVIPLSPNGFCYVATTGGKSGSSQPTWPTSTGTVTDGTVTWSYNGPASPLMQIQAYIGAEGSDQTASFGSGSGKVTYSYHVYQNRFIKFGANNTDVNINSTPGDSSFGRYLKVQIGLASTATNYTPQTLTTLFTM